MTGKKSYHQGPGKEKESSRNSAPFVISFLSLVKTRPAFDVKCSTERVRLPLRPIRLSSSSSSSSSSSDDDDGGDDDDDELLLQRL